MRGLPWQVEFLINPVFLSSIQNASLSRLYTVVPPLHAFAKQVAKHRNDKLGTNKLIIDEYIISHIINQSFKPCQTSDQCGEMKEEKDSSSLLNLPFFSLTPGFIKLTSLLGGENWNYIFQPSTFSTNRREINSYGVELAAFQFKSNVKLWVPV